jgi:hypothetical protein
VEWVVPSPDDERYTQRLSVNVAPTGHGDLRSADALGLHPGGELLACEAELRECDSGLRGESLRRRLAEVGSKRVLDVLLTLHEEMLERIEL